MNQIYLLSFFLLILHTQAATQSGVFATMNADSINKFKNFFLPEAIALLKNLKLPDIHGSYGPFSISISSLVIPKVYLDSNQVSLIFSTDKLQIATSALGADLTGHVHAKALFISQSANIDAEIRKIKVNGVCDVSMIGKSFHVNIETLNVEITSLHINIHGSIASEVESWIVNQFSSQIKSAINGLLNKTLKDTLQTALNGLFNGKTIQNIPHTNLAVNYTISNPQISNDHIQLYSDATLFNYHKAYQRPPGAQQIVSYPAFDPSKQDIQVSFSEYVVNSGLYALWTTGQPNIKITNDLIPKTIPVQLNTATLEQYFPGLTQTYGNKNMTIEAGVYNQTPSVNIKQDLILGTAWVVLKFNVVIKTSVEVEVVTLSSKINFSGDASAEYNSTSHATSIKGEVKQIEFGDLVQIDSKLPKIDLKGLHSLLNQLGEVGCYLINSQYLQDGIPLPKFLGIEYQDPKLEQRNGYLFVGVTPVFPTKAILDEKLSTIFKKMKIIE